MIQLTIPCALCKEIHSIKVTQRELNDYNVGEKNIQSCFPKLNSSERELILTQTCGKCFDEMFEGIEGRTGGAEIDEE